ncbi:MAG: Glycerol-3-phosphate dehydrogenase (NAD(P)+) [Firmicutes bacterium]|nr:Glycerol-3-phosphate dehydrogenase (NAD(P)+) [candidate division NPL-UPA2 bacterium]
MKIGIVGGGGWGTALALVVAKNADKVVMWVREDAVREEIRLHRANSSFLPGVRLPENVTPVDTFTHFAGCDLVILAVPSAFVRVTAGLLCVHLPRGTPIVSAAKGLEFGTNMRLSLVLSEVFGKAHPLAVLSGPNIALEVGRGIPSAAVVASPDVSLARAAQRALMTGSFRVYTSPDLIGVELGGALKNVIALAAGVIDGLEYGDNTKAALMTRGMTEIVRLGKALGAEASTFAGLSGMGDLIVTCTSAHSRNRRAGLALGQGRTLAQVQSSTHMVIEGVNTTRAAYQLAQAQGIEMPITEALHDVLFNRRDPREAVMGLMTRNKKNETEEYLI